MAQPTAGETPDEWFAAPLTLDAARARFIRPSSRFLRVGGVDLHVLDEPRAASGPTVVLLSAQWLGVSQGDGWAPLLTGAGRILRLDLPAQGLSGGFSNDDYSARAYADLVAATLDQLDAGPHVVVGTSFSGIAAALYAAMRPAALRGLVLATASGLPRPPGGPSPHADPPAPFAQTRGDARPRGFYAWKLSTLLCRTMAPLAREALIDEVHWLNELPGRAREARRRAAQYDACVLPRALPEITVPLLVQWSSASTYLPPAMAQAVAALARETRAVYVYPQTGHLLLQDAPRDCGLDLQSFLDTL